LRRLFKYVYNKHRQTGSLNTKNEREKRISHEGNKIGV